MDFNLQPWKIYLVILAGWVNRQQQEVIQYLLTENQVLKEKLGKKRILLNDDQRRLLAVKGKTDKLIDAHWQAYEQAMQAWEESRGQMVRSTCGPCVEVCGPRRGA
jgi:hypothetical protein